MSRIQFFTILALSVLAATACEAETAKSIDYQCREAIDDGYLDEGAYLECVDSYTRLADDGSEDRTSLDSES